MNIHTVTGLHGELVAFIRDEAAEEVENMLCGWAVVRQPAYSFPSRAFSTHYLYYDSDLNQCACWGHYDMTLAEAREDVLLRVA